MSSASTDSRVLVSHAQGGLLAWLKLPLDFDADELLDEVRRVGPAWWTSHFNEREYEGRWEIAPLRSPAGETHPIRMAYSDPMATEWVDTSLLEESPALRRVLDQLACPCKSARLMRLASGARIREHTDHETGYEDGEVRLHLPIETSPGVEFRLNGQRVEMRPGELWYVNVNLPHSVANLGPQDRTHLVIDCAVNSRIEALFRDTTRELGA